MKKILFLVCLIRAVGCGAPQDVFVIEGHVPSLKDSTLLTLLSRLENGLMKTVDTAYVSNGRFSFHHPTTEKGRLIIRSFSDDVSSMLLTLWSEPGEKAVITGNNNLKYTWSVKSRIREQQEAERYKQASLSEYEELQRLDMEYDKLRKNPPAPGERDSIANRIRVIGHLRDSLNYKIYDKTLDLLSLAEPSVVFEDELSDICMMIRHYEAFAALRKRATEQYDRLPEDMRASPTGKEMHVALYPPIKVGTGDRMADTELVDLNENTHRLSDYLGKYILLDFWAFWCGPCLMSMPDLKAVSELYQNKLTVVGVCSDAKEEWERASKEHDITWVNLNASGDPEFNARYGVNGIPHQVFISPEGIILGSWTGYGEGYLKRQLENYISD
ncbi:MAG: AhpC/TSA family protein [Rikenellaceae bacterium]|jgi:thiol-disulfide isomerase/thioredoxin|nr:AhpC/TSA family protein [Rikenellaceae bacterium]